ncbi:alanine racemase [Faecalitalea cylindroides]|uniref:alanine racemase n=1 Tax=Faecalitalea cylindroides TaxID=39483 RepID=UPI000B3A9735|nr:alanine racemase [Faecalitalea cylindroides]OUN62437.1 alanine racemase [Faecalitalea cylindroides]
MLKSYSRAWCEIDYKAINHNLDEIQKLVGKTKIMGIVKANAYGHGDVACARQMAKWGVDFFGVSSIDEALNLRENGIDQDILILGYTPVEHFHYLYEKNIVQSLVSFEYAQKLNTFAKENDAMIRCHCKVDTGMCRTGIIYQDQDKHMDQIIAEYRLSNLSVEGIFSHFPVSDDLGVDSRTFTENQIRLFKEVIDNLKKEGINCGIKHIQNSYGILNYMDLGMDYCRPGLLYMGVTSDDQIPILSNPDFIPIMSIYANVSLVKWIQEGQSVSYGRNFIATKPTKVATVSIGYADGIPRLLSNQGFEVLIHGKHCKVIGNICMDQCMVDVTDVENVKEGDICCFVGQMGQERVTIDTISRLAKTINNETMSAIAARVPRLEKR